MAKDHALFTARQYEFGCERLEECGRMTGGWLKSCSRGWLPPGQVATPLEPASLLKPA